MEPLLYYRAAHIVGENARVRVVEAALKDDNLPAVGEALNASHESSRVNFENSIPQLDTITELLKEQPNVYGARLTGGGFGGAVMAMTDGDFNHAQADMVAAEYKATHGLHLSIFHTRAGGGARLV